MGSLGVLVERVDCQCCRVSPDPILGPKPEGTQMLTSGETDVENLTCPLTDRFHRSVSTSSNGPLHSISHITWAKFAILLGWLLGRSVHVRDRP
jgi:hypothetical protein